MKDRDKYSVKKEFEQDLNDLFNEYESLDFVTKRGFVAHDKLEKKAILFIGINPSYSGKEVGNNKNSFYNLLQENNEYQKYFKRFEDISKRVQHKWTHIDLFFFRHTNQKHVYQYLSNNVPSIDFISRQLQITRTVIENIEPRIIVVSNALARDLFHAKSPKGLNFNLSFDDSIGTYRIKEPNTLLNNTPVFFTSMLTGTRALDKGSYERLVWQIKKVLEK